MKSTQTVLSSNGSICEAQFDYNHTDISFKKGDLLELSINGHEVKSLETGQQGTAPMIYIGYSMVELLYLFQFAMRKQGELHRLVPLNDDEKAEYFIQKFTNDSILLLSLRNRMSKQKCK